MECSRTPPFCSGDFGRCRRRETVKSKILSPELISPVRNHDACRRRDSEDSSGSPFLKNFLQSGLSRFGESFGTELSSRCHASGFPNRVADFSKKPVGRSFEFRYASRMQFRCNRATKEL